MDDIISLMKSIGWREGITGRVYSPDFRTEYQNWTSAVSVALGSSFRQE